MTLSQHPLHPPRSERARSAGLALRTGLMLAALLFCAGICVVFEPFGALNAAELTATEEQVKAAYLLNFENYIEWPATKFARANSPLVIGVIGNSSVAAELEKLGARPRSPSSRPIVIRRLTPASDFDECHILFIGRDYDFAPILANLKSKAILTVGEHEPFARRGGMFNFVLDKGTVKFQVNRRVTREAGLQVSSKLLDVVRTWKLLVDAGTGDGPR